MSVPSPLEPLNIANFSSNVPCCCAEGRERAVGALAGARKPNCLFASAFWALAMRERSEEEGEEGGVKAGKAAQKRGCIIVS
jgi:hypothetical protein